MKEPPGIGAAGSRCQFPVSAWLVGGVGVVDVSGTPGGFVDGATLTPDADGLRSLR
jgi:hypothetical protein